MRSMWPIAAIANYNNNAFKEAFDTIDHHF